MVRIRKAEGTKRPFEEATSVASRGGKSENTVWKTKFGTLRGPPPILSGARSPQRVSDASRTFPLPRKHDKIINPQCPPSYSQLRQNCLNNSFQAKVGKELPKQFPELLSVGKLDVGNFAFPKTANTLQARNFQNHFQGGSKSVIYYLINC